MTLLRLVRVVIVALNTEATQPLPKGNRTPHLC